MGFESTGFFKTVYANEFDPYPVETFEQNFDVKVDCRDIHEVKASEIPDFDVMLAGFPCQAFSIAGLRKGFDDEKGRGTLFFELVRIFKEKYGKEPEVVAIHAGLECGMLSEKLPGLDCVSIGPDMQDIHTSREKLEIESTRRTWEFLLEILKAL